MERSLIQGIEVLVGSDRLVLRNSWAVAALGRYFVLACGTFLFGGFFVFVILFWLSGEPLTPTERYVGLTIAIVSGPLALLGLLGIGVHAFAHRKRFVFDKATNRFQYESKAICPLSNIARIRIERRGFDPTEYAIVLVQKDGQRLTTLDRRLDEFRTRDDAERLATAIAGFLGIEVDGIDRG